MRHDIAKRFGQRVKKVRLKRSLSQEALAAKADIDRAFLSGIERGIENPSLFLNSSRRGYPEYEYWDFDEGHLIMPS